MTGHTLALGGRPRARLLKETHTRHQVFPQITCGCLMSPPRDAVGIHHFCQKVFN